MPSVTNTLIAADPTGKAIVTKEYLQSNTSGTLDEAYDFGGAGAGRSIVADAGAVTISGTDGLVSTGTLNSGAMMPGVAGVQMVWNPRKAAIRAGSVSGTHWSDANTGLHSTAFGQNTLATAPNTLSAGLLTTASGSEASAFGNGTMASGQASAAFGRNNTASGLGSAAFGSGTISSANHTLAAGFQSTASGNESSAFGVNVSARSFGETVFGTYNTTYTPVNLAGWSASDRLFSVGNGSSAAARSDAMVILKNGRTGIGTSQPRAPLHVRGVSDATNNIGIQYFNQTSPLSSVGSWSGTVAAYFEGNVLLSGGAFIASNTLAFSDARIKDVAGISDSKKDLETLSKIEIVDYSMIDKVSNPTKYKKVIAQQVEQLMPDAVSKTTGYLPSIYKQADEISSIGGLVTVKLSQAHNLVAGDEVKLISEQKGELLVTVESADATTFSVKFPETIQGKLFVYGKKVDDFRAVDYDAISMLNVSATQELFRLLIQANERIEKLEQEKKSVQADVDQIRSDVAVLMKLMAQNRE